MKAAQMLFAVLALAALLAVGASAQTTQIELFEDTGYDLAPGAVYAINMEVGYKAFAGALWAGEAKVQIGPMHAKLYHETSFFGKDTFYLVILVGGEEVVKEKVKELGFLATGSGKVSATITLDAKCNGSITVKYNDNVVGSFSVPSGGYYSILKEENGDAKVDVQLLEQYDCSNSGSGYVYKEPPNLPPSASNKQQLQWLALGAGVLGLLAAGIYILARRG